MIIVCWSLQMCEKITDGAVTEWIDEMSVPYAVNGNQWYGYDDERSVQSKVCHCPNTTWIRHEIQCCILYFVETTLPLK